VVLTIYEVYLSSDPASFRPDDFPEGRAFLTKPGTIQGIRFTKRAILDTEKIGQWNWPETDGDGGWAPWRAFSSYLPIFENTGRVLPWQWPFP
jgi:hypothetical protein